MPRELKIAEGSECKVMFAQPIDCLHKQRRPGTEFVRRRSESQDSKLSRRKRLLVSDAGTGGTNDSVGTS